MLPALPDFSWTAEKREIVYGTESVVLSPREAVVFQMLYAAAPAAVPRERLRAAFARREGNGADVYIGYLRRRLKATPARILTVRGEGYALAFCTVNP